MWTWPFMFLINNNDQVLRISKNKKIYRCETHINREKSYFTLPATENTVSCVSYTFVKNTTHLLSHW